MQVNIELPEDISEALLKKWSDLPKKTLESLAIEGYRTHALTESQIRRLLGFENRMQVHQFLKDSGVYLDYTSDDLRNDLETHRKLGILPADDRYR
jgi:predicted HTH domain antitoxin